jgi:Bax protein
MTTDERTTATKSWIPLSPPTRRTAAIGLAALALVVAGLIASATAHDRSPRTTASSAIAHDRSSPRTAATHATALPDFRSLAPQTRKAEFFEFLRPIATDVLADVQRDRAAVLAIASRVAEGRAPSRDERATLERLAAQYGVTAGPDVAPKLLVARLAERVDSIPMSLLLVQAAKESGWGTSRFAVEGNSLFGERCYSPDCGIAPAGLANPKFNVRRFATARDSVASYVRNINTHSRYSEFRRLRRSLRERGESLDSVRLAATLEAYSERRAAYVTEVKQLVAQNGLPTRD